jgi:hypothetical protein
MLFSGYVTSWFFKFAAMLYVINEVRKLCNAEIVDVEFQIRKRPHTANIPFTIYNTAVSHIWNNSVNLKPKYYFFNVQCNRSIYKTNLCQFKCKKLYVFIT